jgi:hypothetical protein
MQSSSRDQILGDAPRDQGDDAALPAQAAPQSSPDPAAMPQSRMDRIKAKIRKMQGKNPDIYPMW